MQETKIIAISEIKANPYQPRLEFDGDALLDLAQSIQENGLIQPISVRLVDDKYEIVAGERRFRAMKMLGKLEVPVIVLDADNQAMAQLALIENIQRENLSAIEEAKAYVQIMEVTGLSQTQLAKQMGKSQGAIANKIRLLQLTNPIQEAVATKKITERHARALIGLEPKKQQAMLKSIVKKGLTVAQTEQALNKPSTKKATKGKSFGITQDMRIAINTIKRAIDMVIKTGVKLNVVEDDSNEEYHQLTIRFPR